MITEIIGELNPRIVRTTQLGFFSFSLLFSLSLLQSRHALVASFMSVLVFMEKVPVVYYMEQFLHGINNKKHCSLKIYFESIILWP